MWPHRCLAVFARGRGHGRGCGWMVCRVSGSCDGLIFIFYFIFYFHSSPPLSPTCTRTDDVLQRSQCQRRALVCEYPAESRRGMRKKKALPEGPLSASGSSSSAARGHEHEHEHECGQQHWRNGADARSASAPGRGADGAGGEDRERRRGRGWRCGSSSTRGRHRRRPYRHFLSLSPSIPFHGHCCAVLAALLSPHPHLT
ncbi:hypothetical protein B0H14DRAFT_1603808 [Mycena olivaceomarginata]|nr:hypothetical protein B0H14DRAFT_1603808 [Mycena olivaceomarginata]